MFIYKIINLSMPVWLMTWKVIQWSWVGFLVTFTVCQPCNTKTAKPWMDQLTSGAELLTCWIWLNVTSSTLGLMWGIHGGSTTCRDSTPTLGDGSVNSMPWGGTLKVTWPPSSMRGHAWWRDRHNVWNLVHKKKKSVYQSVLIIKKFNSV